MKLSKLLCALSDVSVENFYEQEIMGVASNSELVERGWIFVAIKGARVDGNSFIFSSYSRGARVFVTSKKTYTRKDCVCIYSEYPRKTLAELCAAFYGSPEKRMQFVGVTGTKGKTTTTVILSKILSGLGIKNAVVGTLGITADEHVKTENTTPDPTVLFPALKECADKGVEVAVIEVSSQALKDFRVWGIRFDLVAFTGIGIDHIGGAEHATFTDYARTKRRLFREYGAKSAVVNSDDPFFHYMSADVPQVIKCGFSETDGLVIRGFKDTAGGGEFFLDGVKVTTALPGEFNARNVTMAIAIAQKISGASLSEAASHADNVRVLGRFERKTVDGKNVIIDYAHNQDSFKEIISLCRRLYHGRIICVFGSVGGRSFHRREELAACAEKYADFSVITSDNPGDEFPLSVCSDIYSAFHDKTRAKIIVSRESAIRYAIDEAALGDTVLLLGKGHESYMNIGGKKVPFSDSETVDRLRS